MGDVLNLRQARKRVARERKAADAKANRIVFGFSKTLKTETAREKARDTAALDACRLDHPHPSPVGAPQEPSGSPAERRGGTGATIGERAPEGAAAAAGRSSEDGL